MRVYTVSKIASSTTLPSTNYISIVSRTTSTSSCAALPKVKLRFFSLLLPKRLVTTEPANHAEAVQSLISAAVISLHINGRTTFDVFWLAG